MAVLEVFRFSSSDGFPATAPCLASTQAMQSRHVSSARPWFRVSTKKPSMTSSCCSCHHAVCTLLRWPPGPSNKAYLSSPHLEASPATTFRACSSPAPTPVKPQPAPAILSQESVHTTLSITRHTRKRPSTGPRTTHGPHSPLSGSSYRSFTVPPAYACRWTLERYRAAVHPHTCTHASWEDKAEPLASLPCAGHLTDLLAAPPWPLPCGRPCARANGGWRWGP
jgi:hypothetical protein